VLLIYLFESSLFFVEEIMRSTILLPPRSRRLPFLVCWALCWMTQSSEGFLPPTSPRFATPATSSFKTTTTQLHVFERMSEECVAAIITAQQQTNKLQKPLVSNEAMLAGCVDHPGTAALERTLKQYRITWRQMERTMDELYGEDNESKGKDNNSQGAGWLSGFRAAKTQEDRPFGADLKLTLKRAGALADQMGSTTVHTHHVFLALLQYKETADDRATAATVDSDCGSWNILMEMRTFDIETVTALEICQSLLKNLEEQPATETAISKDQRELVTGAGDSKSKTPTLADCGTDLTKLARDGLLDPVYGREKETRSCIRTLMRRRKNNVCLIGEAGVGKVSGKEDEKQSINSDFIIAILILFFSFLIIHTLMILTTTIDSHCRRRRPSLDRRNSLSSCITGLPLDQSGTIGTRGGDQVPRRIRRTAPKHYQGSHRP
jgi:hypothetical protein